MVQIPCVQHDAYAAGTQFLMHTVGQTLATLELRPTPIDTRGYETLLRLVDNTCSDSFDLYNGLFMYKKNSTELLNRLEWAMDSVKKRLFDDLHDVLWRQLFDFEGSPADPAELLLVGGDLDAHDEEDDGDAGDDDESGPGGECMIDRFRADCGPMLDLILLADNVEVIKRGVLAASW
jgi:arogenate dehydrogenase (NADP+)